MAFSATSTSQRWRTARILLLLFSCVVPSLAYPAILHVDEKSERCFRFNIPEDDDADIIALMIPNEDEIGVDSALETWYAEQVYKVTKAKEKQTLSRKLPDSPPDAVAHAMSEYLQQSHGQDPKVQFKLTGTPMSNPKSYQHKYGMRHFQPLVLNYVARTTHARSLHRGENNMEGYGVCIENDHEENQVQVIFDMILLDDVLDDDEVDGSNQRFAKETHLSPLESSLEQSIRSAEAVLREMKFMEKRESRMRKTSDSINMRVRWFAYLSISVLLSVTYVQVTYLKRYFQKKKLM